MNVYKRKYNIKNLVKVLQTTNAISLNIDQLLDVLGFDPIDIYHFYINNIRGRFRYDKEYNKDSK